MNTLLDRLATDFGIYDISDRKPAITTLKVEKQQAERLIRELRDREGLYPPELHYLY
jgi:hypothetical protein